MAVLMASLNGLYIASFPQKMGHHIICYEYRQIFLTTVTVPTSKKRLSGGARVVKHAPLARVQGEQHTFPNQAHTRMKWPIFAVFVSLSLLRLGIASEHRPPAVNGEGRTVDKARVIREKIHDGGSNLLGAGNSAKWMQLAHLLFDPCDRLRPLSAEECLIALGHHRAWCYSIHANAMRSVFNRQRPCESLDGCFGDDIRCATRNRLPCLIGGEINNCPGRSGRLEAADRGRAPNHGRIEIQSNQVQHRACASRVDRGVAEDGSVVDPAGERARGGHRQVRSSLRHLLVGSITHPRLHPRTSGVVTGPGECGLVELDYDHRVG